MQLKNQLPALELSNLHLASCAEQCVRMLQMQSLLLAFTVVLVGVFVWVFGDKGRSCWAFLIYSLGEIPLQIIGAAVAWHMCFLYMPKDVENDPVIQVSQCQSCAVSALNLDHRGFACAAMQAVLDAWVMYACLYASRVRLPMACKLGSHGFPCLKAFQVTDTCQ